MALIPSTIINEILSKIDIADYIGQYTTLNKRGRNMMGSCPFHEDRNPSMSIHMEKQIFNCFSCQRKGNVLKFIMEMDAVSYPQAIQKAAEYANVLLDSQYFPTEQTLENNRYDETIYQIHDLTKSFYAYHLTGTTSGQAGMEYLQNRNLSDEIIRRYQIGLAPKDSHLLLTYLKGKGFSEKDLIDSGIFFQTESGKLLDRFRDRLVFPLRDAQGYVIGFSARVFGGETQTAKYINSPETSIFHKNRLLFNLDQAKSHIRKTKEVLICEGFMDILRLESIDIHNGVATMGTALSDEHLRQLSHWVDRIIFVFDGDQAGQNATEKAYQYQPQYSNLNFESVKIPNAQDPDEWIKQFGSDAFRNLLEHTDTYFDFQKKHLLNQYDISKGQDLAAYIEALLQSLTGISSPIERQIRLNQLSQEFKIERNILEEQFSRLSLQNSRDNQAYRQESLSSNRSFSQTDLEKEGLVEVRLPIRSTKAFQAEKLLLQSLIYNEGAWRIMESQYKDLVFFHDFAQTLFFELESAYLEGKMRFPLLEMDFQLDGKVLQFYLEILENQQFETFNEQVIRDCVYRIEEAYLELELEEWTQKAQEYDRNHHIADASEALSQIVRIKRKLGQLKHQLG